MDTIAIGVDPALGGGHAMCCARLLPARLEVIDARSYKALHQTEQQLALIESWAKRYRPGVVIIEYDAQQKGLGNDERLAALAGRHGFSILPHMTRGEKSDPVYGVASMDQSFARGDIRIPWGDDEARTLMADYERQLRAWRPDVLPKRLEQDLVMATWFVWRFWMRNRSDPEGPMTPASRPSWMHQDRRLAGALTRGW